MPQVELPSVNKTDSHEDDLKAAFRDLLALLEAFKDLLAPLEAFLAVLSTEPGSESSPGPPSPILQFPFLL